jgi:hypothetical protein
MAMLNELVAAVGSTAVLPYDSPVQGFSGSSVPNDDGLTLVGNTNAGDTLARILAVPGYVRERLLDCGPDFAGVVLDPARARVVLGEFSVGDEALQTALVNA